MRTVIWDMGGTMLDTYPATDRCFADVVRAHGKTIDVDEVAVLTRRSTSAAMRELACRYGIEVEQFEAARSALQDRWRTAPPPCRRGLREAMATVNAAGGLNLVCTHRERGSAQTLLDAHGLRVDDMVCAPDGHPRKPDPTMFQILMERHHMQPSMCGCVGDRPIDVESGRAAGVETVFLSTEFGGSAPGADHVVRTVAEVVGLVG